MVRHHRWMALGAAITLACAWLGWRYGIATNAGATTVRSATLHSELFGPGIVDATARSQLSPKTNGRIVELRVHSGDQVAAGATLVRLQSESAEALLQQAQAQLASARAQLVSARADSERATALADQADRDRRRLNYLAERDSDTVAVADLDLSITTFASAVAEESRARAQVDATQSAVLAAQGAVAYQASQLAENVLAAPFAGVITQRIRSVGDTVGPGSGILEVADPASVFIQARFDESLLPAVSLNAQARVAFHSSEGAGVAGHVARIDRVVDGETREFIVEIALDALPSHWALGQRADVYVQASVPIKTALPRRYVRWNDQGAYVWVLRNGRATRQPVAIGLTSGDAMQIISGLTGADLVLEPSGRLYPGRRVYTKHGAGS